MLRKISFVSLLVCLILISGLYPVMAQDSLPYATYQLTMRTGAGTSYDVVTYLDPGTPVVLEARNNDISWVLGHTEDGAFRGWLYAIYLTYPPGYAAARLPVSNEVVGTTPAPEQDSPSQDSGNTAPAPAGGVNAYAVYDLNVRSGPGTQHAALGYITGGTGLILEARNGDASWVLAQTPDGATRGWFYSIYIKFEGVSAWNLPESGEIIRAGGNTAGGASSPSQAPPPSDLGSGVPSTTGGAYDGIVMGSFDPATVAGIDLAAYPAVGQSTARARAIFLEGRAAGRNPNVLAKVGDCSTEHWYFLNPFAWGQYNLGPYTDLQGVINHFGESLAYNSEASHNGYNVNTVMNPDYANQAVCEPGESPMDCEYRIHNPSVAVIMFGTSDLLVMSAYEFDFYLRDVVRLTIEQNIVPILSTFPSNLGFWNHTVLYNQIVIKIAQDYNIPLINLWVALESLPNHGVEDDGFHLDTPPNDNSCFLTADYLDNGYNVRNLVTLQTLDAVWKNAMQ
jgi:uncharacterized protein YraI